MVDPLQIPIYITTRDRVSDLRLQMEWLERAGHQRITFIDNASTYEPLREYLAASPHSKIMLAHNAGSRALWTLDHWRNEDFILTDPDVIPTEDCPLDMVRYLQDLLSCGLRPKVALGLTLHDVPVDLPSLTWERDTLTAPTRLVAWAAGHAWHGEGVYDSLADTTFALYRAGTEFCYESLRTGAPSKYMARHMTWYRRPPLDEEHMYYLGRADHGPLGTSWEPFNEEES